MGNLNVGYGRAEITPPESVHMSGYGNDTLKFSGQVLDPLYATCLSFTDETGRTALLFATDTMSGADWMREVVSREVGIPEDCINVSGSHTHAGPCVRPERLIEEKSGTWTLWASGWWKRPNRLLQTGSRPPFPWPRPRPRA